MIHVYNRYVQMYGVDALSGKCNEISNFCDSINDVVNATNLAGNFF